MNISTEPESEIRIAFSDCDPFGHLNNGRYIDYFLDARENQIEEYYEISLKEWSGRGLGWFVTQNHIAYLRPAQYAEKVILLSRLIGYTANDLLVEMLMYDKTKSILKAFYWARFKHIDLKQGKRAQHDEALMKLFAQVLYSEDAMETNLFEIRLDQIKNPKVLQ